LKTITIVQARLASTRLPRKVLAQLTAEDTILSFMKNRIENANHDSIWLATTTREEDIELVDLAQSWGWRTFRGSESDVLSRFTTIGFEENPDWIIRVTADNPLTHLDGLNLLIEQAKQASHEISYISDFIRRRTPLGSFPEIIRFDRLANTGKLQLARHHKSHVTSAIVESGVGTESLGVNQDIPLRPEWRWTVDEQSDLDFMRALCESDASSTRDKNYRELVRHIDENLWLVDINRNITIKKIEEG
jgi:spore coat polysaccharide biosynthesis protein SpsF (cytidylyltransferase family)